MLDIIINHILPCASITDIDSFSKTCHAYEYLFNHEPIWRLKCEKENIAVNKSYKHQYIGSSLQLCKEGYQSKSILFNTITSTIFPPVPRLIILISNYGIPHYYILPHSTDIQLLHSV